MIKCSRCFTEQSGPMICVSCANDLADIGTKQIITLRQQLDALAEACRYFVDGWRVVPTDKLDIAYRLAEAALVSIEGNE